MHLISSLNNECLYPVLFKGEVQLSLSLREAFTSPAAQHCWSITPGSGRDKYLPLVRHKSSTGALWHLMLTCCGLE